MNTLRAFVCCIALCIMMAGSALAASVPTISAAELLHQMDNSKGKVLIVVFWATWCSPCVREMPGIVAVRAEVPESELQVVGVSLDTSAQAVANFVQQYSINFPVFMDAGDVAKTFGVKSIPRTFIFSRSGEKVLDHLGTISAESFRHVVEKVRHMP
ncbi:hypothetical protein MASR1M90_05990 [Desulfovibrionales bacterium]